MGLDKLTDDLENEVKTKWPSLLLTGVLVLLGLLAVIIWREALSETAQRVWSGASKSLLGALLAVLSIVVCALIVITLRLHSAKRKAAPTFIKRLTVKWDIKTHEPHCPHCLAELAQLPSPFPNTNYGYFKCIPCKHAYLLIDEKGERLTLEAARALVFPTTTPPKLKPNESSNVPSNVVSQPPPLPEYVPDDIATEMLRYIYYADPPDPVNDLARVLNIDPLQVEHRMDKLTQDDYLEYNHYEYMRSQSGYSLTAKGKEFLVNHEPPTPKKELSAANEKLDTALLKLKAFRSNLTDRDMDISDMDEYHSLLDTAQTELQCDLSEFRIPPSAIKTREIPGTVAYMFGQHVSGSHDCEQYILPEVFKRQLDALIPHIEKKRG